MKPAQKVRLGKLLRMAKLAQQAAMDCDENKDPSEDALFYQLIAESASATVVLIEGLLELNQRAS